MYPLGGVQIGPVNPNTKYTNDGKPIVMNRTCETCLVQWWGEVREECWSCGVIPGSAEEEK